MLYKTGANKSPKKTPAVTYICICIHTLSVHPVVIRFSTLPCPCRMKHFSSWRCVCFFHGKKRPAGWVKFRRVVRVVNSSRSYWGGGGRLSSLKFPNFSWFIVGLVAFCWLVEVRKYQKKTGVCGRLFLVFFWGCVFICGIYQHLLKRSFFNHRASQCV